MQCSRSKKCRRRGTTMVEFAFVLPLIMLFFIFTVEISRVMMLQHTADTAAYEACRAGMVPGATNLETRQVAQDLLDAADLKNVTVTIEPDVITEDTGLITVKVDVPVNGNFWVTPDFFQSLNVSSEVTLLCERSPLVRLTALPKLKLKKGKKQKGDKNAPVH